MTTPKELALNLLHSLIDLEVKQAAMTAILDSRPAPESQLQPWRAKVRSLREDKTLQGSAHAKYADIEKAILASPDECPDALFLLAAVVEGLVE